MRNTKVNDTDFDFFPTLGEDFWRWQTENPNGYADDEPYPVSSLFYLDSPGKNTSSSTVTQSNSTAVTANGVNGHDKD